MIFNILTKRQNSTTMVELCSICIKFELNLPILLNKNIFSIIHSKIRKIKLEKDYVSTFIYSLQGLFCFLRLVNALGQTGVRNKPFFTQMCHNQTLSKN